MIAEDTQCLFEYDPKNIVSKKTCFKSKDNLSCIDRFITISPNGFRNASAIKTVLSDFHKKYYANISKEIFYQHIKKKTEP